MKKLNFVITDRKWVAKIINQFPHLRSALDTLSEFYTKQQELVLGKNSYAQIKMQRCKNKLNGLIRVVSKQPVNNYFSFDYTDKTSLFRLPSGDSEIRIDVFYNGAWQILIDLPNDNYHHLIAEIMSEIVLKMHKYKLPVLVDGTELLASQVLAICAYQLAGDELGAMATFDEVMGA